MGTRTKQFEIPSIDKIIARDYANIKQREDHENRPQWVCPNRHIFQETYSPIYKQAYDFLIATSEPISRPKYIHEYLITKYSQNTAASQGQTTENILSGQRSMSKTEISQDIINFITENTAHCGKVKIVLKNRRYFVESLDVNILEKLQQNPIIRSARIDWGTADKYPSNNKKIGEAVRDVKTGFMVQKYVQENILLQGTGTLVVEEEGGVSTTTVTTTTTTNAAGTSATTGTVSITNNTNKDLMDDTTIANINDRIIVERRTDGKSVVRKLQKVDPQRAMGIVDTNDTKESINDINTTSKDTINSNNIIKKENTEIRIYYFEINANVVQTVRHQADELSYPMLEEYDFRNDEVTSEQILPAYLKPSAQIREYQEKALSKMFGNGRARSGIIVLPCGAGKTLVGITAMSTIARSTLIVCSTAVAVHQWRNQIKLWTNIPSEYIHLLTQGNKEEIKKDAKIIITTYPMLSHSQKRSINASKVIKIIKEQEWGQLILDEVHVAPADKFKLCLEMTHSRCKLGLTATLVREDEKIKDLFFLLGPKQYEANWMDLSAQGFIAVVKCIEILCPMIPSFYQAYLREQNPYKRTSLCVANPEKINTLEALVRMHEQRNDKIMIFSEQKFILELLGRSFHSYYIHGDVSHIERMTVLKQFGISGSGGINVIFISKIGDNSIDLPDTNVIIQLSAHYASRRQEAQRQGRILRPKPYRTGSVDAFFYTLISQDTEEQMYGMKRQRFLVDQGYAYEVKRSSEVHSITRNFIQNVQQNTESANTINSTISDVTKPYKYSSVEMQEELLRALLKNTDYTDETAYDLMYTNDDTEAVDTPSNGTSNNINTPLASWSATSFSQYTGGADREYFESKRPRK